MPSDDANKNDSLGFLTVEEHAKFGVFGGYLLLNTAGRPLEFHCTAPVRPNRAQEILYGATLKSFLCGEQIGHTLVQRSKLAPAVLCTDHPAVTSIATLVKMPVCLVLPGEPGEMEGAPRSTMPSEWLAPSNGDSNRGVMPPIELLPLELGVNRLAVCDTRAGATEIVTKALSPLARMLDLHEPFERIREAIEEARRTSVARSTKAA